MMKFLVAIVMFALIGLSLTSAAAIETGENDTPESIDGFKENLKNLLSGISEAIKANAKFDENVEDLKSLVPDIEINEEEPTIDTEEEEDSPSDEISASEDDENDNSRMYCSWRGRTGHCCKSFRIARVRLNVCLSVIVHLPSYMSISLRLNGHTFWRHTLKSHHRYRICIHKGHFRMCFYIYRLYISSHSVRACLYFRASYRFFHYRYRLGCFYKRFGENEISTNKETRLHLFENQKDIDDLFLIPKEINQNNDVLGFKQ